MFCPVSWDGAVGGAALESLNFLTKFSGAGWGGFGRILYICIGIVGWHTDDADLSGWPQIPLGHKNQCCLCAVKHIDKFI